MLKIALVFDRGQALLDKQKIIDKINTDNDQRTLLKSALLEVSMIAEAVPKDIAGDEIPPGELNSKWTKIKEKVDKLNV